jgi:hypothetical protein
MRNVLKSKRGAVFAWHRAQIARHSTRAQWLRREIEMLIRRLGGCVAVVATLALVSAAVANPITIVVDTSHVSDVSTTSTFVLYFQLTGSSSDSVAIADFMGDATLEPATITRNNDVAGALETNDLVLTGGGPFIPAEYFERITLGNAFSFTFDANRSAGDGLPATFALQLLDVDTQVPPFSDTGTLFGDPDTGSLLTFEFGTADAAGLVLFPSVGATLSVAQAPEPGTLELIAISVLILAVGFSFRSRRIRPT